MRRFIFLLTPKVPIVPIVPIAIGIGMLLLFSVSLRAQTVRDIFDPKTEITWLGLDFTATKVVGDKETWAQYDAIGMFGAWNQLMISEREKYDVAAALHRDHVKPALEIAMEHNKSLKLTDLFEEVASKEQLTPDIVHSIVNSYDFKGYSGIGIMFMVEKLDKPNLVGVFVVTFINMNTKEVLFMQRMTNKPAGFGLRNYWASCVYKILKRIKSSVYATWQKRYAPKVNK